MAERLVPTLGVGMPSSTLRVVRARQRAAERPGRHSHAERGNELPDFLAAGSKSRSLYRRIVENPEATYLKLGEWHWLATFQAWFKNAHFRVTLGPSAWTLSGPALERVDASPG